MSILDVYANNYVKENNLFVLPLNITVFVMMLRKNLLDGQIKKMRIVGAASIVIVFLGSKIAFVSFMIIIKIQEEPPPTPIYS